MRKLREQTLLTWDDIKVSLLHDLPIAVLILAGWAAFGFGALWAVTP